MTDEILMMRPQRLASMGSSTCLLMLNRLSRLVRMTSDQCGNSILRMLWSRVMPALLTSTSMRPNCASTLATASLQAAKSLTSMASG